MNTLYFTAARDFEAARQLDAGVHGHGFRARLVAAEGSIDGGFPGGDLDALNRRLNQAAAPLDYGLVNDHLDRAGDETIGAWLLDRLDLAGESALSLKSAPDRGAVVKSSGDSLAWRGFRFESAHRLPRVPAGHKCGRMHGHGFETMLYVSLDEGRDAASTQSAIAEAFAPLHADLHLRCLNDLPGLSNPTSEVLARWIWQRIEEELPGLVGVTVMETASAGCHFDGSGWRIWKSTSFDSAVRLAAAPEGDPRRMVHGHTYTTRLHLSGGLDEVLGWVYDYGDLKQRFDPLFRALDHQPLYEQAGLDDNDSASIARWIDRELADELPGLSRIDVLESPDRGALLLRGDDPRGLLVP